MHLVDPFPPLSIQQPSSCNTESREVKAPKMASPTVSRSPPSATMNISSTGSVFPDRCGGEHKGFLSMLP